MYAVKNQMRTNLSYIIISISYYLERNVTMFKSSLKHSWEWELDILRMDQKHLAVLFENMISQNDLTQRSIMNIRKTNLKSEHI